jgi:hypothetical protein
MRALLRERAPARAYCYKMTGAQEASSGAGFSRRNRFRMGAGALPGIMTPTARNAALVAAPALVAIAATLWLVLPDAVPLAQPAARTDVAPAAEVADPRVAPSGHRTLRPQPEAVVAPVERVEPPPDPMSELEGLIAKYADRLADPQCDYNYLRDATVKVNRKAGLDGQRRMFAMAAEKMAPGLDSRRAAMLLGQIEAARAHGLREAAGLLPEAILAMDPDWAPQRHGLPRLVAFAGGPNVSPWSAADRERELRGDLYHAMWSISGAGGWDGGTWVAWEEGWTGREFFAWVDDVARDDNQPEAAMAASIWVHAVLSRHHWQQSQHGLVPAAVFRVREARLPASDQVPGGWWSAFTACRAAAHAVGAEWEAELRRIESALAPLIGRDKRPDLDLDPLAIWSLTDEFARRFTVDALARRFGNREFPRAEELQRLAAYLVQLDPPAAGK